MSTTASTPVRIDSTTYTRLFRRVNEIRRDGAPMTIQAFVTHAVDRALASGDAPEFVETRGRRHDQKA